MHWQSAHNPALPYSNPALFMTSLERLGDTSGFSAMHVCTIMHQLRRELSVSTTLFIAICVSGLYHLSTLLPLHFLTFCYQSNGLLSNGTTFMEHSCLGPTLLYLQCQVKIPFLFFLPFNSLQAISILLTDLCYLIIIILQLSFFIYILSFPRPRTIPEI